MGQAVLASRRERLALAAAVGAGILFRVVPYARRPSFWLDEARLALNLGARSFAGLLRPLDYDQAAPPLFLWAEKLAMLAGGANEYALRALPLLAGLLVPTLTYVLGRRLAGTRVAVLSAALTSVSPALVYYSVQLKPYASDAAICLFLLISFVLEAERGRTGWALGPWTIVLGTIAIWASTSAPFGLATIALISWRRGAETRRPAAVAALAAWCVSFLLAYVAVYRPAAANPYLAWFWRDRFLSPWLPGAAGRAYGALRDLVSTGFIAYVYEMGSARLGELAALGTTMIVGLLAAVGMRSIARKERWAIVLLCGPTVLAVVASICGVYPVGARLMLFAMPALMILVAAGLEQVRAAWAPAQKAASLGLFGLILAGGILRDVVRIGDPGRDGDLRPGIGYVQHARQPGEPVYVMAGALPAWTFYTTDWTRPDTARLTRMALEGSSGGRAFENAPSRGRRMRGGEGASLAYPFGGGVELLGIPDGAPVWEGNPWRPPPDSGWAESEAGRIKEAARPTAWVVATTAFDTHLILDHALRRVGGLLQDSVAVPWILVARYRFPVSPGSTR